MSVVLVSGLASAQFRVVANLGVLAGSLEVLLAGWRFVASSERLPNQVEKPN